MQCDTYFFSSYFTIRLFVCFFFRCCNTAMSIKKKESSMKFIDWLRLRLSAKCNNDQVEKYRNRRSVWEEQVRGKSKKKITIVQISLYTSFFHFSTLCGHWPNQLAIAHDSAPYNYCVLGVCVCFTAGAVAASFVVVVAFVLNLLLFFSIFYFSPPLCYT